MFHGVTALIMFAAFVVDAIVWYKAPEIQFNDNDIKPTANQTNADNNANEEPKGIDSETVL